MMEAFCLGRGPNSYFECLKFQERSLKAPFVGLVIDLSGIILKKLKPGIKDEELRMKELDFKIRKIHF